MSEQQHLDRLSRAVGAQCGMSDACPWLARLTALTRLDATDRVVAEGDEMLYLPAGLQELVLRCAPGLQQLPSCISRLSALRLLDVNGNSGLCHLPDWLSKLSSLEALGILNISIADEQAVLASMPRLRCVQAPCRGGDTIVLSRAPYLHFSSSQGGLECW
jgi:hypothetical protein